MNSSLSRYGIFVASFFFSFALSGCQSQSSEDLTATEPNNLPIVQEEMPVQNTDQSAQIVAPEQAPFPEASSQAPSPTTVTPQETTPPTVSPAPVSVTATIKNFTFNPSPLPIKTGTTVTWTNEDAAPHTVTSSDGSFDSGTLRTGESFSYIFSTAGTFDYICAFHVNMKGQITVE